MVQTDKELPICDPAGNNCFWNKMDNFTYMKDNCYCLSSCQQTKFSSTEMQIPLFDGNECYPENYGINAKEKHLNITPRARVLLKATESYSEKMGIDGVLNNLIEYYKSFECGNKQERDISVVEIRMDGQSFIKYKQSLRVTNNDKIGNIGGTLGASFGFSFLAIAEAIYWFFRIMKSCFKPKRCFEKAKSTQDIVHLEWSAAVLFPISQDIKFFILQICIRFYRLSSDVFYHAENINYGRFVPINHQISAIWFVGIQEILLLLVFQTRQEQTLHWILFGFYSNHIDNQLQINMYL